ncbi:MAG: T9SS type A sorting domain-containing protein [Ignavibacteriales bacterium]|nr:MAG: T9SS type A sorting domain-containing protein [Ignavibacteriales bacterium]
MYTRFLTFIIFSFIACASAQWQQEIRLTNDPSVSYLSYNNAHCIGVDGSSIHIVWWDGRDLDREIYYKNSFDFGQTWSEDTRLTNIVGWSEYPAIAVTGNYIHVVWQDDRDLAFHPEIYYKRSTDGGISWEQDKKLATDPSEPGLPSLAVAENTIHIVWIDLRDGNTEIYYKSSLDNGVTWLPDVRLTNDISISERSSIAVNNEKVFVVWQDERDNDKEIYFKKSSDNGNTWSGDIRLTNSAGESETPVIAANGENIYVVWSDSRDGVGNAEIFFKRSSDNGLTWSEDIKVKSSPVASNRPSLAVSSDFIHISWNEVWEVYYTRSSDNGTNWDSSYLISNSPSWTSENSSIALSDSAVHIIWMDQKSGNEDIYYIKNSTGNIITGINSIENQAPSQFLLSQNYPNPFNPVTRINYTIPANGFDQTKVILKVFDILGNEIATLVNEYKNTGSYTVEFDINSFHKIISSGMYFYTIETNHNKAVKKMILLK